MGKRQVKQQQVKTAERSSSSACGPLRQLSVTAKDASASAAALQKAALLLTISNLGKDKMDPSCFLG